MKVLLLAACSFISGSANAITSLNVDVVSRSVVFFFASDAKGQVLKDKLVATGFLILVPNQKGEYSYPLIVTARHVVDPIWAGCETENPGRLFIRVNMEKADSASEESGVSYLPIELETKGSPTWQRSVDDSVDVAVLKAPRELLTGKFDVRFLNYKNFGSQDEIDKIGVGSQTASAGLVAGLQGEKRNNPIFHFGKIASVPTETASFQCKATSQSRHLRVWLIATTLVPGTSGSPIFFDPLFPPGADISAGEPRAMIIGLQSLSWPGADLAGMTPTKFIMDVILHSVGEDADLRIGMLPH